MTRKQWQYSFMKVLLDGNNTIMMLMDTLITTNHNNVYNDVVSDTDIDVYALD